MGFVYILWGLEMLWLTRLVRTFNGFLSAHVTTHLTLQVLSPLPQTTTAFNVEALIPTRRMVTPTYAPIPCALFVFSCTDLSKGRVICFLHLHIQEETTVASRGYGENEFLGVLRVKGLTNGCHNEVYPQMQTLRIHP